MTCWRTPQWTHSPTSIPIGWRTTRERPTRFSLSSCSRRRRPGCWSTATTESPPLNAEEPLRSTPSCGMDLAERRFNTPPRGQRSSAASPPIRPSITSDATASSAGAGDRAAPHPDSPRPLRRRTVGRTSGVSPSSEGPDARGGLEARAATPIGQSATGQKIGCGLEVLPLRTLACGAVAAPSSELGQEDHQGHGGDRKGAGEVFPRSCVQGRGRRRFSPERGRREPYNGASEHGDDNPPHTNDSNDGAVWDTGQPSHCRPGDGGSATPPATMMRAMAHRWMFPRRQGMGSARRSPPRLSSGPVAR
jgi:hypothetical protein